MNITFYGEKEKDRKITIIWNARISIFMYVSNAKTFKLQGKCPGRRKYRGRER
jgi:hypothetical protein